MLKSLAQRFGEAHGSFIFHLLLQPDLAAGARHGALAGRMIVGASFGTLTCQRSGRLVSGAGTILLCCWRRSCWCLLRQPC